MFLLFASLQMHSVLYMQIEDRLYIYLEYVHPGSINKYVRQYCGAMTESVVRNFTRHILNGLIYLHSKKIMHRSVFWMPVTFYFKMYMPFSLPKPARTRIQENAATEKIGFTSVYQQTE